MLVTKKCLSLHRFYAVSAQFRPVRAWAGALKTSMERDLRAVVSPVSKGRFRTLLSVLPNLATLNQDTAVMQLRRLRRLILYLPAALYLYNYIIRCTPHIGVLSYPIFSLGLSDRSVSYIITWRGQDFVLLILILGQCEGLISEDKCARDITPTSFLFP